MPNTSLTVEREGNKIIVSGDTYPFRDRLRDAGAKWDPRRRAWIAPANSEERIRAAISGASSDDNQSGPGLDAVVAGRALYKGKAYYIAGRRDRYGDVDAVTSRAGDRVLLYSRDGTFQFWARLDQVEVTKMYSRAKTIRNLQEFAQATRSGELERCGQCGGYHRADERGCYMCGCPRCPGAFGGLCDED